MQDRYDEILSEFSEDSDDESSTYIKTEKESE